MFTFPSSFPSAAEKPRRILEDELRRGMFLNVLENYLAGTPWTLERVARDLWQNFFDANGFTVEGVRVELQQREDGRVTVRLSSASKFPYNRIISFGGGYKEEAERAAGGQHEGTRIIALHLLRDYGCREVVFGSGAWRIIFYLDEPPEGLIDSAMTDQRGVYARLVTVTPEQVVEGNFVQFSSTDPRVGEEAVKARELFYYRGHHDFASPDITTERGGFRLLAEGEKGDVYLNGQRINYLDKERWHTLERFHIWTTRTPEYHGRRVSIGRDREALSYADLHEVVIPFLAESMTVEQAEAVLFLLEPFWEAKSFSNEIGKTFVKECIRRLASAGKKIRFSDQFIAHDISIVAGETLTNLGYKLCFKEFAQIGMASGSQLFDEISALERHEPSPEEEQRIEALYELMRDFTAWAARRSHLALTSQTAEALGARAVSDGRQVGPAQEDQLLAFKTLAVFKNKHPFLDGKYDEREVWISLKALRRSTPGKIASLYLHEICHKFGTDSSAIFSYALTGLLEIWTDYLAEHGENYQAFVQKWNAVRINDEWRNIRDVVRDLTPLLTQRTEDFVGEDAKRREKMYLATAEEQLFEIIESQFQGDYSPKTFRRIFLDAKQRPAVLNFEALMERIESMPVELREEIERELENLDEKIGGLYQKMDKTRRLLDEKKQALRDMRPGQKRGRKELESAIKELERNLKEKEGELGKLEMERRVLQRRKPSTDEEGRAFEAVFAETLYGRKADIWTLITPDYVLTAAWRLLKEGLADESTMEQTRQNLNELIRSFAPYFTRQEALQYILIKEMRAALEALRQRWTPRDQRYARFLFDAYTDLVEGRIT